MNGKPFYKSRTLQTSFVIIALTWLMQLFQNADLLKVTMDVLGLFGFNPPPDVVNAILVTLSLLVVSAWRFVTRESIQPLWRKRLS